MTWIYILPELYVSVEVARGNAALHCWARLRFMWLLWGTHVGNRWWNPASLSSLSTSLLTKSAHTNPVVLFPCFICLDVLCHFTASDLESAPQCSVSVIGNLQLLIRHQSPPTLSTLYAINSTSLCDLKTRHTLPSLALGSSLHTHTQTCTNVCTEMSVLWPQLCRWIFLHFWLQDLSSPLGCCGKNKWSNCNKKKNKKNLQQYNCVLGCLSQSSICSKLPLIHQNMAWYTYFVLHCGPRQHSEVVPEAVWDNGSH